MEWEVIDMYSDTFEYRYVPELSAQDRCHF